MVESRAVFLVAPIDEVFQSPHSVVLGGALMSDPSQLTCSVPGCGYLVPAELEAEILCVSHFLLAAEKGCSDMRRETAGGPDFLRRAAIQNHVATTAVKLACIVRNEEAHPYELPHLDDPSGKPGSPVIQHPA